MRFLHPESDVYLPWSNISPKEALGRTTHLCIGAHPDDIEAMAAHGISECFGQKDHWFTGVTVTDGAGSARTGPYVDYTDEEMRAVRRREQQKAALGGDYSIQIQLGYTSDDVKQKVNRDLEKDLCSILSLACPETVYLHQPADKHETHVAVFAHSLNALRKLPAEKRPRVVYGCEGWRNLDWLDDSTVQLLDAGTNPAIDALLGFFDSQNRGGKRFDLAVPARRRVNATFHDAHTIDAASALTYALDLTPLVRDQTLSVSDFILSHIDRFRSDVQTRVSNYF